MAPSRRKGAKKSSAADAAAAAACRQWKVGDLVLAKVKGFPAWPAMVSEPGKWGYSTDRKKVLVHFFGTQQIAFCNPADVDAFTEEKKQSLAKRQGRGADFVLAVKEIIECYEKLEREAQVANANVSNSIDPPTNSGLNVQVGAPWTINSQMKSSDSVTDIRELFGAAEDDSAVAPRDASYNKEATSDAVATATVKSPLPVTQGNKLVRSSKRSSRIQNLVVSCSGSGNNGGSNDDNISADAIQNISIRRIKRIRKSPNRFARDDTDSSAFTSNVSVEEIGSEIITNNSDACSLNEGSTMDSNLKLEQSETIDYPELVVGLNKALDHEIKAVIDKKRKSNGMVETNDAGAQNASQSLQNVWENLKERFSGHDGDAHLPLLKRARVRMCKSSSMEAEHNSNAQVQEKSCTEDIIGSPKQIMTSFNCENGSLADGDSVVLSGALAIVSPKLLAPCTENGTQIKKDQNFGCFMDYESILPPSKRIQRALKAMSANAAEGVYIESPSSMMTSSGRCNMSAVKRSPSMAIDNQGEDKSSREVDKQLTWFQQHESGKDVIPGAANQVGEALSDSVFCQPAKTDSQVPMLGKLSPNLDVQWCQVNTNQDSPGLPLPPNKDDHIRPVNHSIASDTLNHGRICLDLVAGTNESVKLLPQSSINMPQHAVVVSEDMKQTDADSSKINDTHDKVVKEVKFEVQEGDTNYVSKLNDCSGEKSTLGILASLSLSDADIFLPQGSPPNTSVCNVSTSNSSNILQNGSCSPDILQKNILSGPIEGCKDGAMENVQSRSMGKSTEAGDAALLYFEAMLGTLTRTRESISRATRIAIDCAKFGIANKVVEILVHNLETESSLRRRVDLFFLVDAIAQSSRGGKGDVVGVYPSAMQAVLPRLLSATAPPGSHAQENRRQCLKILRLWLRRRILPESIIHHHIRELNSYGSSASARAVSRSSLRTERALDDPIREMEGMHVDEYGSNSSFRLPGFCMPRMLEDGGSDSDGGNFEAVTPEHETHKSPEPTYAIEKHRHVLEDVDGELEMEDVSPSFDDRLNSICNVDGGNASQIDKGFPHSCTPLPQDVRSSSPFPPSYPPSPPPPPPPPPPTFHLMSATSDQYHAAANSKAYTDLQTVNGKTIHSLGLPLTAPRNRLPISDAVQFRVPECRDMRRQIPESPCPFNTYPVQLPENSRSANGFTMDNKGYVLRPPRRVPSDQFSFVRREHHLKSQREVSPPPSHTSRHHFVENMRRENFYNNHERLKPPPYDYHDRWNNRSPYSGVQAPHHGYHPSESPRFPGHGWRFRPSSMNYRDSIPYRPPFEHFEDAIPVANRGPKFWPPRC